MTTTTSGTTHPVDVRLVGGPTVILEIGGLRLLTDPTFDPPGDHPVGADRVLTKVLGPAVAVDEIGRIDAVLLSHDQHPDNLDASGRELLRRVPVTITTPSAAARLDAPARGLGPWRHTTLPRPDGSLLRVTAVPAHHGPEGTAELLGEVTGFVLSGTGLPVVYVSGDNTSLEVVAQVARHCGPVDIAVLSGGAGRTPVMDAYLTLSNAELAQAGRILGAPVVVPVHLDAWAHLTEGSDGLAEAFAREGESRRLVHLTPGEAIAL